jgi:hypothetical protein
VGKELAADELRTLIWLARRALWSGIGTRSTLQSHGINITPANFYSSVPLLADLDTSFEFVEEAAGIAPYASTGLFDPARTAAFIESISAYADEFDPPVDGDPHDPAGFYWGNPAFSFTDAMSYYCILRAFRPTRVLEIGSGFSTLVADMALRANGSGELVLIEPYPKPFLRKLATVSRLIEQPVQSLSETEVVSLVEQSQVWFIDSTHTVKSGSDCLYIYLKIMPKIRTSILCHTHDVYLPYALPSALARERHVYWTEQYLLLAYLLDNPKAEVLTGTRYLQSQLPDLSRSLMRGRYPEGGGSFWYRLNTPSD